MKVAEPGVLNASYGAMRVVVLAVLLTAAGCSLPQWPVSAPVTSPFGLRFMGIRPDFHYGVDLAVPVGTPVSAMQSGLVAYAGEMRGYGLVVIIQHHAQLRTVYAHLSETAVRSGDRVKGGQVIGKSGRSGNVTGAHLHFEIQRWGREEDPVELLGGLPPASKQ